LGLTQARVEELSQAIIISLTQRQRLHLLQPTTQYSLTESNPDDPTFPGEDADIADLAPGPEQLLENLQLQRAWQCLDPVEQYVLEAMLFDEIDANDLLAALRQLDIAIHPKVDADKTDRQQLYYFKRKTLVKLKGLLESGDFK
jgi:hypothetical protein